MHASADECNIIICTVSSNSSLPPFSHIQLFTSSLFHSAGILETVFGCRPNQEGLWFMAVVDMV